MDFFPSLIPIIEHFQYLSYWIVFLISLLESVAFVGLLIPGTIFMLVVGLISSAGALHFGSVFWLAVLGAIIGDGLSYSLGWRSRLIFKPSNKLFKTEYLEKGKDFFRRHGNISVFLSRFVGPLRSIVPFVAGAEKMPKKKFLFWNILSALGWSLLYLALGYFIGEGWQITAEWSGRPEYFVSSIVVFFLVVLLIRWIILRHYLGRFWRFLKSLALSIKEAILDNPDVKKLIAQHPALANFLKKRFGRGRFSGWPLTLFVLAFLYILFLLFGVVEGVLKSSAIVFVDERFANLMYAFRHPWLIKLFLWLTALGSWQVVITFAAAASLIFWLWQKRQYILTLWLTIGGAELFTFLSKLILHRPRPELAVYLENTASFPSGHATIAVAFYGFIAYVLWQQAKNKKRKLNIFLITLIIAIAIGFSRLYLRVHFVSDVWGGYLIGLLWLIIGISLTQGLLVKKFKPKTASDFSKSHRGIISIGLIAAAVIFYIGFSFNFHPLLINYEETAAPIITDQVLSSFNSQQLSKYTETLLGSPQEPLSFIIITKDDNELINVFTKAGWQLADPVTPQNVWRLIQAAITNTEYLRAPMTPSLWNAQVNNFGFQKATAKQSVRQRHHARFWKTDIRTSNGRSVYVGTASLDIAIKYLITHRISPDIDTERETLFTDLQATGLVFSAHKEKFVPPTLGTNFSGDQFFTDGETYVIELK